MRIGIRVSPRSSGGGRAYIEGLRGAVVANPKCDTLTVFMMGRPSDTSVDTSSAVIVDVPASPIGRRVRGGSALTSAVRENPVDVMLCPGTEATGIRGVSTVMWPMTVAPFEAAALAQLGATPRSKARWSLLRRSIVHATQNADALVFSSHYARALHLDNIPKLRGKPTIVIPPAHTLPMERAGSPREIDSPYLLFVSHLYPYKMVAQMIEGFARAVRRDGIPHQLVIAGNPVDAKYAEILRVTSFREGVADRVQFLGGVEQARLPGLYENADLFLFPSISENAGSFALVDAFTMGVPVLSSSTSSMPEACQDAVRYFDPRDPEQLSNQIGLILRDPSTRAELAKRSLARAAAFPGWQEVGDRLVEFFDEVTSRPGARS